ncbi:MAG: hypothetical protein H8E83_07150 [Planctomycetes bacterium]|nr:hypothetical protein [Planctomycetota bacterium]
MSHLYLLGVATLTLTSASFAGTDTNADLQARLEAAEARINELSAATNNNWLNDTRADEIRGLVHDVLADADTRASLQGSAIPAGYNGGFTIGSADGNWSMKINGLLQTRWVYLDDDDPARDSAWGFDTNRAHMTFSGTIAGDYGYSIRHNLTNSGAGSEEEWAYGTVGLGDGWTLAMGDLVLATNRAAQIDDGYLMTLDRAEGDAWARATGTGISLNYESDDIRAWVQVVNNNDGAVGPANADATQFNGRVEFMVDGNWGQFDQIHSNVGDADGTVVGLTYWTADSGDGAATNDGDTRWTADALMQWGGTSLYVGWSDFSDDSTSTGDTSGFQAVFSMDLEDNWEVYGRYADQDDNTGATTLDGEVLSVGVNNYWAGQNAKWTIQVDWDNEHAANDFDTTTVSTQLQFMF